MSIIQMSLSAGLLVIAVVVTRAVALNRLPKTMFIVLWSVVLLRLLVPVSIPMQYSVYNIVDGLFDRDIPAALTNFNAEIPSDGMAGQNLLMPEDLAATWDFVSPREQAQNYNTEPLMAIWLVGMIAALTFFTVIYFKNHRALRFAIPIRDNGFLNEWLAEHRLSRPIAITQSDRITTPLAVGWIKPRIILPKSMNMDDKPLLGYVLTHEFYHIKRCDALWKVLLVLALCVHWFNPLVWVMFAIANRDLELTCDEMVIRHFGAETRTAYAYTLISMAEQRSKFAPLYNGFSRNAAEERIVSIMKNKKTTLLASVLAIVLVSALTVGVLVVSANGTQADVKNSELPFGTEVNDTIRYVAPSYEPGKSSSSYVTEGNTEGDFPTSRSIPSGLPETIEVTAIEASSVLNQTSANQLGFQSPYKPALSIEEVRDILAMEDGSIPVTNVKVPEIISGQTSGIIITDQDLYEALAVLNEAYMLDMLHGVGGAITHLISSSISLSVWNPEEYGMFQENKNKSYMSFAYDIIEAASAEGIMELSPDGGVAPEVFDRVIEEAQRILALYSDAEWPSIEDAHEAALRLFGEANPR